jgi:hypothetical protein
MILILRSDHAHSVRSSIHTVRQKKFKVRSSVGPPGAITKGTKRNPMAMPHAKRYHYTLHQDNGENRKKNMTTCHRTSYVFYIRHHYGHTILHINYKLTKGGIEGRIMPM